MFYCAQKAPNASRALIPGVGRGNAKSWHGVEPQSATHPAGPSVDSCCSRAHPTPYCSMPTNLRDLHILCGKEGALILQLFKTKPAIVVIGVVGLEMINKIKERSSTSYCMAQRFRRTTLHLSGSPK